jgi:hypothetical protein
MNTTNDLMQRLAVSKKIMDKHSEIKRGSQQFPTNINVQEFETPQASYNIPQEFLSEGTKQTTNNFDPTKPVDESRIMNSKLPEEIKRLMIEQPIVQPNMMANTSIPDEIIEGAQRLMNMNQNKQQVKQESKQQPKTQQTSTSQININEMKTMIRNIVRDTVRDVIREELESAGLIAESTDSTNEVIQFKVGKHVFVGRVTKVQKLK